MGYKACFLCVAMLADCVQATLIHRFWHKGPNGNHLCLVLPLAGPRIEDYWKNHPAGGLTLAETQKMALDAATALAYLHANRFVHGGR
jgi:serine/threonine-protein kinase SRPK3